MRIIKTETKAYKFDELTPEAQEKALDNCRNTNVDYSDWYDSVYEMVETAANYIRRQGKDYLVLACSLER